MSQKNLPPGRRQIIHKLISKINRSLTVDEIVKYTGIPKVKIRQTLTTYDTTIVRIGSETYDTVERIYPGRTFRYTPKKIEIEKGLLFAEEDLHLFLTAAKDYWSDIVLIDDVGNSHILKRNKPIGRRSFYFYQGLGKWYKKTGFEEGDDILFTCFNLEEKKYKIIHQKKRDRDEFTIKIKNKKLADMVYKILSYTILKYELDTFLVRKYLFVYPFSDPVPPDHLTKAIWDDKRFLISTRDKMLSWTGHPMTGDLDIGLKKYYFLNEKGEYVLVEVLSDEYGRYGFCTLCNERLIWEKDTGWRHCKDDTEWTDSYLTKDFFEKDKEKIKTN